MLAGRQGDLAILNDIVGLASETGRTTFDDLVGPVIGGVDAGAEDSIGIGDRLLLAMGVLLEDVVIKVYLSLFLLATQALSTPFFFSSC